MWLVLCGKEREREKAKRKERKKKKSCVWGVMLFADVRKKKSKTQHRSFFFVFFAMSERYGFGWEAPKLIASLALFLLSGLLEIVGGWFVWRAMLGGGGGESSSDEAAAIDNPNSTTTTSSSSSPWRGFPTPPRASPARLWLLLPGMTFLVLYGFVPVLQTLVAPSSSSSSSGGGGNGGGNGGAASQSAATFGRVFAVYGGFFIALSYLWGWLADGSRPDGGDALGASVAVAGVLVAWFWPRARG